ncbi:MAG: hypothetical protein ACLFRG_09460 [Desulfococcaceae bacterium]
MASKNRQLCFAFPSRETFFDGRRLIQLRLVWPRRCRCRRFCREQATLFDRERKRDSDREEPSGR